MSTFDNFLAGLFPEYAVRRIQARRVVAAWDAAKPTRTHKIRKEDRGPNLPVAESAVMLRQQARHLEQNNDIAKGALDILATRTVGMGIIPEFMVEDTNGKLLKEVNEQFAALYAEWCRHPEVTWTMEETEAQRLSARTFFRDGEYLIQHILGRKQGLDHGSTVPYSYELIEGDLLPMHYHNDSPRIVSGVQMNEWGRPTQYHLLKNNPNDMSRMTRWSEESKVVPARRISHLANRTRFRQVRGISVFAVVLKRLQDIDEIDETERVAARMAAAMAVFIKKGDPTLYNIPDETTESREILFEPGMVVDDLLPGEDVSSIISNRPNNQLIAFKESQLRAAAAGLGTSYSSLAKDYNGTYSAQRQELVEQYDNYGVLWKYLVERAERPKIENFLQMAMLAHGLVELPPSVNPDTLMNVNFSRPALPWIQPLQEAKAWGELIEIGIESKTSINRSRGRNNNELQKQITQEKEDAEETTAPED